MVWSSSSHRPRRRLEARRAREGARRRWRRSAWGFRAMVSAGRRVASVTVPGPTAALWKQVPRGDRSVSAPLMRSAYARPRAVRPGIEVAEADQALAGERIPGAGTWPSWLSARDVSRPARARAGGRVSVCNSGAENGHAASGAFGPPAPPPAQRARQAKPHAESRPGRNRSGGREPRPARTRRELALLRRRRPGPTAHNRVSRPALPEYGGTPRLPNPLADRCQGAGGQRETETPLVGPSPGGEPVSSSAMGRVWLWNSMR